MSGGNPSKIKIPDEIRDRAIAMRRANPKLQPRACSEAIQREFGRRVSPQTIYQWWYMVRISGRNPATWGAGPEDADGLGGRPPAEPRRPKSEEVVDLPSGKKVIIRNLLPGEEPPTLVASPPAPFVPAVDVAPNVRGMADAFRGLAEIVEDVELQVKLLAEDSLAVVEIYSGRLRMLRKSLIEARGALLDAKRGITAEAIRDQKRGLLDVARTAEAAPEEAGDAGEGGGEPGEGEGEGGEGPEEFTPGQGLKHRDDEEGDGDGGEESES